MGQLEFLWGLSLISFLMKQVIPFGIATLKDVVQCLEPEALIPLSFVNEQTQIALFGDHLQLGPVVRSPIALKLGLDVSLQGIDLSKVHAC